MVRSSQWNQEWVTLGCSFPTWPTMSASGPATAAGWWPRQRAGRWRGWHRSEGQRFGFHGGGRSNFHPSKGHVFLHPDCDRLSASRASNTEVWQVSLETVEAVVGRTRACSVHHDVTHPVVTAHARPVETPASYRVVGFKSTLHGTLPRCFGSPWGGGQWSPKLI